VDLTPEHVYRSCAEAAWDAPGTQRLWNGNQRDTYIELMLARPDWRAIVDVAYRAGWGDHSTLVHDDRAAYQAGREDAARDIARACEKARDEAPQTPGWFAYDHAAGLARMYRVPDCGDEYHGADGGPCSRCGFDVADQGDQRICTCPDCDVTAFNEKPGSRTVKGLDPSCPAHGSGITEGEG
jgi:hypothetical protein